MNLASCAAALVAKAPDENAVAGPGCGLVEWECMRDKKRRIPVGSHADCAFRVATICSEEVSWVLPESEGERCVEWGQSVVGGLGYEARRWVFPA